MTINFDFNTGNMGIMGTIVTLLILGIMIAATWQIFVKGGEHGWAIFIPFYGNYCQFRMLWGSGWMFPSDVRTACELCHHGDDLLQDGKGIR